MKIYLCNNTVSGHSGSKAVMLSLLVALKDHTIIDTLIVGSQKWNYKSLESCDAVLVNGEGTIHHNSKCGNALMDVLKEGQKLKKKTLLINSVFQQEPLYYKEVLKKLDFFSVRDPISQENASKCGRTPVIQLDACVGLKNFSGTKIKGYKGIVKGKIYPGVDWNDIIDDFNYPTLLLDNSFLDTIATLKDCDLYITGQHHGMYAAGLAGIPFVVIASNSHKIEGTIKWFGKKIPVCKTKKQVEKAIKWSLEHKEIFKEFQEFLFTEKIYNGEGLDG